MLKAIRILFPTIWGLFLAFGAGLTWLLITKSPLLEELPPTMTWLREAVYISLLFTIALAFLMTLTYLLFVVPVGSLRKQIALFLIGSNKSSDPIQAFHPDIIFLNNFFQKSLEILKTFKSELQSGRVLKSEVELAADIQRATFRKQLPMIPSMDIVANSKSATEVGGDAYDVIQKNDNYYIYLGDVTSHGVASGFVMMIVNALISGFSNLIVSGAEILAQTNYVMKPRVKKNMLMTLLMVRWNEVEKKLFMTGAGHEYLIVYKAAANQAVKVKSGGIALGMTLEISRILKEVQIRIEPGDIIILYTDGITEARNGRDPTSTSMFGVDRLVKTIEEAPQKTAQGVFNHITITLSKFMGYQHKQFDDITLIVGHYHGGRKPFGGSSDILPTQITEWNW